MRMGMRGGGELGERGRGTMPSWTPRGCANCLNAQRVGSRTPAPVPIFFFPSFYVGPAFGTELQGVKNGPRLSPASSVGRA